MSQGTALVMLALLAVGCNFPLTVPAGSAPLQEGCPGYQANLVVDVVDVNPHEAAVGATITVTVHVVYPDGTPVILNPQTISFVISSGSAQKLLNNVHVVPVGSQGFYQYSYTVAEDSPTGLVTISVSFCSCADGGGNWGPPGLVNSDTTLTPSDDSKVQIGPQGLLTGPITTILASPYVLTAIAALLIIALILLVSLLMKRKRKSGEGEA